MCQNSHRASWRTSMFKLLFILILPLSCSYFNKRGSNIPNNYKDKIVTKEQYDKLMNKYGDVVRENKSLKEKYVDLPKNGLIEELSQVSGPNNVGTKPMNSSTVSIDDVVPNIQPEKASRTMDNLITEFSSQHGADLETYHKAKSLKENGRINEAMKIFQQLQKSQFAQVQVRARYHVADLLIQQNEYDLALQALEDIIQRNAFSKVTLDALKKAAFCYQKLGVEDKRVKYESLVSDVFGY